MIQHKNLILLCIALFALVVPVSMVAAQGPSPRAPRAPSALLGTAFTYQGQLKDNGAAANGAYDFEFRLFDAASSGTQIGGVVSVNDAPVTNGYFTVPLDFGASAFNGDARFLEIRVRPGASGGAFTTLSPLQPITPAPYALALPGLSTQQNATSPNLIGGYKGNSVTNGVFGAAIGGGGYDSFTNRVTDNYNTVSGGSDNQAGDNTGTIGDRSHATVSGGSNNTASGALATIGGGNGNTASGSYSFIGGGVANVGGAAWAAVGGGTFNNVSNTGSTIAGGYQNTVSGFYSTVAGGRENNVPANLATVPGGLKASASHYGEMAYASGAFATAGDAQTSTFVLRNTTADATPTELFLDGSAARLAIANNRVVTFDILVVGVNTASGDSAGYRLAGVARNIAGTTSLVGSPNKIVLGEIVAAWDVNATADDASDVLIVQVTGSAATNIRWVASARTVEVAY